MIAHHVLFWLKADTSDTQKTAFFSALQTLEKMDVVKNLHIGTPAPIKRAVVDDSYTFSLLVMFDNLAGHDVYQAHPLHTAFLDEFKVCFNKVVIYDAQ